MTQRLTEKQWIERAMHRRQFLRLTGGSLLGAAALSSSLGQFAFGQNGEVAIVSHNDPGNMDPWVQLFQETTDLSASVINLSSGPALRRIRSENEGGNLTLDAWWGAEAVHSIIAEKEGLLTKVETENAEVIPDKYKSDDNFWFGYSFWANNNAINENRMEDQGLDMPQSWLDLEDPQYQNEIAAPDPNQSGTGFLMLASWVQMFGWDRAFQFVENLDKNVLKYTESGSTPARSAANGEVAIGLTWDEIVMRLIDDGFPLRWWVPEEGFAYSLDTVQALKGAPHPDNAIATVDYALSEKAMIEYTLARTVITRPNVPEDELKSTESIRAWLQDASFIDYDIEKASNTTEDLLNEWNKRVG